MTWTNAFDVGECAVRVSFYGNGAILYSGTLAKGEESAEFPSGILDQVLKVAVSPEGAVSLDQVSGFALVGDFLLEVIPSYSISSSAIRVSSIDVFYSAGLSGTQAISDSASIGSADSVALILPEGGAWIPDPADLSAMQSKVSLAIYMGNTPP